MRIHRSISASDLSVVKKKFSKFEDSLKSFILGDLDKTDHSKVLKTIALIGATLCALNSGASEMDPVETGKQFSRYMTSILSKSEPEKQKYFTSTLGIRGSQQADSSDVFKDLVFLFTDWFEN